MGLDADFSHAVQMSRNGIGKTVDSRQVSPTVTACHNGLDVISRALAGLFFDKGQFTAAANDAEVIGLIASIWRWTS